MIDFQSFEKEVAHPPPGVVRRALASNIPGTRDKGVTNYARGARATLCVLCVSVAKNSNLLQPTPAFSKLLQPTYALPPGGAKNMAKINNANSARLFPLSAIKPC